MPLRTNQQSKEYPMTNEATPQAHSGLRLPENPFSLTYSQINNVTARKDELAAEYRPIYVELKDLIEAIQARSSGEDQTARELAPQEAERLEALHRRSREVRATFEVLRAYLAPLEKWWEQELRRDPGFGGMRDRPPPWEREQIEELQEDHHANWHWEEPTEPGDSGWVKNDDGYHATAAGYERWKETMAFAKRMDRDDESISAVEDAADALVVQKGRAEWARLVKGIDSSEGFTPSDHEVSGP
jgi:hypothetical protein